MQTKLFPLSNPLTNGIFQRRARVFKALAHPTRAYLVDVLSGGRRCVCDLAALAGADVSTVSKHLSLLRNAGIVFSSKEGLQVHYELRAPCVLKFFDCVEALGEIDRTEATARRRTLKVSKQGDR